jgi:hypothetical protein
MATAECEELPRLVQELSEQQASVLMSPLAAAELR